MTNAAVSGAAARRPANCRCDADVPSGSHSTEHLFVGDQDACIDLGLVPLMRWLWRQGLRTRYSCENADGFADVSFWSAEDLETAYLILLVLIGDGDACLAARARGLDADHHLGPGPGEHVHSSADLWGFEVWPLGFVLTGYAPQGAELRYGRLLNYRLRLPAKDLSVLAALLRLDGGPAGSPQCLP